jgi:hypothetical protein
MPVDVMGIDPGSAVEIVVETVSDPEMHDLATLARSQGARFREEAAKSSGGSARCESYKQRTALHVWCKCTEGEDHARG